MTSYTAQILILSNREVCFCKEAAPTLHRPALPVWVEFYPLVHSVVSQVYLASPTCGFALLHLLSESKVVLSLSLLAELAEKAS